MSKTRRLSYRLHEGEALLVGEIESFEHLITMYEGFAEMDDLYDKDEREKWLEMAAWVREWLDKTAQLPGYEGE
jgi:hypothetical protein